MTLSVLQSLGFTPHAHAPHFGYELNGVSYLYRVLGTNHQYVSLVAYADQIVEMVFEAYAVPKNTRRSKAVLKTREAQKQGLVPLVARLYWTDADLLNAIDKTYDLGSEEGKKGA